jgi:hypothetical protein
MKGGNMEVKNLAIVAIVISVIAIVLALYGSDITGFGVSHMPDKQCERLADNIKQKSTNSVDTCKGEVTSDWTWFSWIGNCDVEKTCFKNVGQGTSYTFALAMYGTGCEDIWWGNTYRDDIAEAYTLPWGSVYGTTAFYKKGGGVIVTKSYSGSPKGELSVLCETD